MTRWESHFRNRYNFTGLQANGRVTVFPMVDARLRGRGLRQPPGLWALGCQGSVRDRLTPPGLFEGLAAQGSYVVI